MQSESATGTVVTGPRRAHARHPNYVAVAVILFVITAIEVAVSLTAASDVLIVPALFVLMLMKGAGVAGYYMHLRFDSRVFTLLAAAPFLMGVALVVVFFTLFGGFA